ncbi:hypothetical protein EMCG_06433 [[Emmonsia] crescens]|uniref:Protein kinase domain-containing protein n=1 Tax=[Emmonsia] crescens TaxID=73230 RepID=A0A0G2J6T7_9EURO|nr:hypothetical protein EMCG_06433 [Emmonsia crescens UAMH 3008]
MNPQSEASSKPKPKTRPRRTPWTLWLKDRKVYCPFIPDISSIASGIEFLELLFAGGHSYLFKVRLQGHICALKLYSLSQPYWSPSMFERNAWRMNPFNVECQVYDRLIENKLNGKVGPYCHGWLMIDKAQEHNLEQLKLWNPVDWQRRGESLKDPIHGILLEYIEGCTIDKACITAAAAQSLRDQLNRLHKLDIVHGDLFARNIMGSTDGCAFLVDFSAAKLWPNVFNDLRERDDFLDYTQGEKRVLELFLFRLQKVRLPPRFHEDVNLFMSDQLKRHQGVTLSTAQSEEEAYGHPPSDWASAHYAVVEWEA